MGNDELFKILKKVLSRPIAFHKVFATIGGGATEGLFLSQAYYWSQHTKDSEGWFYKTIDDWTEETALTRREQETARRSLKGLGILQEKRKGVPARLFFRVDSDRLYQLIYESSVFPDQFAKSDKQRNKFAKSDKQECHNLQTSLSDVADKNDQTDKQSIYTETTSETTPEREDTPTPAVQTEIFTTEIFTTELNPESALGQTDFSVVKNPELSVKPEILSLGQNSPATLAKAETTADRVRRVYQETGNLPRIPAELEAWVQIDLGTDIVASYRKSGRVTTTKQGDIQPSFVSYVASQHKGKDIDYGYSYIRSLEKDPTKWETLAALVLKWQAATETGNRRVNISQKVEAEAWKQETKRNLETGVGRDWCR